MKNIFDYSHVKSVSAITLLDIKTRENAGKIIANWSDNPNGSVCTAQVIIYNEDNYGLTRKTAKETYSDGSPMPQIAIGKAGGYGYDKLSSAIYAAMRKGFDWTFESPDFSGVGESGTRKFFESIGLQYVSIC